MVTITGNKYLVRTSVSVLAMVLSASMALAEGDETSAGTDVTTTETGSEITVCELYAGPDITVEDTKGDDADGTDVTIAAEDGGEDLPEFFVDPILDDEGEVLPIYYMSGNIGTDPDMVKRDVVLVAPAVTQASISRDPAAVPDLCDIAGPGLSWLCGAKTQ